MDVGSLYVKGGYAGEDTPKALFPSVCNIVQPLHTCHTVQTARHESFSAAAWPVKALILLQVVGVTQSGAADGKEAAANGAKASDGGAAAMDVDGQSGSGRQLHVGHSALGFRRAGMEVVPALKEGLYDDVEVLNALWDHAIR